MSTDFEEAVIAYAKALAPGACDRKTLEKCRRELLRIVAAEFGEGNAFSDALVNLVKLADVGAERA